MEDISPTLRSSKDDAGVCVENQNKKDMAKIYRIRKLTPSECYFLMGLRRSEVDAIQNYPLIQNEKGEWVVPEGMTEAEVKKNRISESQQYKLAGNSIVVDVLLHGIYENLFLKDGIPEGQLF